jgi:tetratricopeptide (TPR) repeat protein
MADAKNESSGPSPAKKRMLHEWFAAGSKQMAAGSYDYATEMFSKCVLGDPSNRQYTTSFLANLRKKYNNNKKGASMAGVRGATTKASMALAGKKKDWLGVLENGIELLKLNPWDTATLMTMADACEHLGHDGPQVEFLQAAVEADPGNVDVNRALARALERLEEFDKAILCWRRVLKGKPNDDEATKGVNGCTVKQTMKAAKYEEAKSSIDVAVAKGDDERSGPTEEQKLERAIKKDPSDVSLYIQLADLHARHEHYDEAEEVLQRAFQASGGDLNIREKLEDAHLRRIREKLVAAKEQVKQQNSEEAKNLHQQAATELERAEMEYYAARVDRYPQNLALKYELAIRLQRIGKFSEAIKYLQECRPDPQHKGEVLLHLGECFQAIKQYRLAMTHFEDALEAIPERNQDAFKLALYRAGRLALDMNNLEAAEEHLGKLAGLDYSYLDVAELLDKVREKREAEAEG